MQMTKSIVLNIVLGVLGAAFLCQYARTVSYLFPNAEPVSRVLLTEPQITVYRSWLPQVGAFGPHRISIFNVYGTLPDGYASVFRFPCWPFVILAWGALLYASFRILTVVRGRRTNA